MKDAYSFREYKTSTFIYFKWFSNETSISSVENKEREREYIRGLGLKYSQFETRERNET